MKLKIALLALASAWLLAHAQAPEPGPAPKEHVFAARPLGLKLSPNQQEHGQQKGVQDEKHAEAERQQECIRAGIDRWHVRSVFPRHLAGVDPLRAW